MEILHLRKQVKAKLKKLPTHFNKIYIRNAEAIYAIRKSEILYLQASSNYTEIFCQDGRRIISSKTLKHYEELLGSDHFIRAHQSYLFNFRFFTELQLGSAKKIVLEGGKQLPVSRSKFPLIYSKLKNQ